MYFLFNANKGLRVFLKNNLNSHFGLYLFLCWNFNNNVISSGVFFIWSDFDLRKQKNFDFKAFLHLHPLGGVSQTMKFNPPTCSKDAMAWRLGMDTLCHRYTTYPPTSFCVRYFHFLFFLRKFFVAQMLLFKFWYSNCTTVELYAIIIYNTYAFCQQR